MSKKISAAIPDDMYAGMAEMVDEGLFSSKTAVLEEGLRLVFLKYSRLKTHQKQ